MVLLFIPLNTKIYLAWRTFICIFLAAMCISLDVKNELRFVDGTLQPPADEEGSKKWAKADAMVIAWKWSKAVDMGITWRLSSISENTEEDDDDDDSGFIPTYYGMRIGFIDAEALEKWKIVELKTSRMCFLMGLNDGFVNLHDQIFRIEEKKKWAKALWMLVKTKEEKE